MKVVLDTNIFVSGIFWKGDSNRIILCWKNNKFTLVTSMDTIYELIRILNDFKIKMPEEMISEWVGLIIRKSLVVEIIERIEIVKNDPKDNMFVETAVSGGADYIVSQDRHLLKIKEFRGV